jgi:hypothetical protein
VVVKQINKRHDVEMRLEQIDVLGKIWLCQVKAQIANGSTPDSTTLWYIRTMHRSLLKIFPRAPQAADDCSPLNCPFQPLIYPLTIRQSDNGSGCTLPAANSGVVS